ncbi:hypothetical protein [Actinophytocola sp. NPDC049390]|uniref:hypothetical protein n=1 Tax=Actinophytocola sp. NPDC049390 TaxID=3363894 RepID=UPI00379439BC
MRALLTTATAALALGVLAGCGDASTPAASDQTTTTTTTSTTSAPPSKTPPETPTPSDVPPTQPEPSAGKPQNPSSGTPRITIDQGEIVVPPGLTQVPAAQVDASAVPDYYGEHRGKVWLHADGFTLETIAYASSGCTSAEAVVVDQAANAVKIILRPLDQPPGGKPDDSICATVMTPLPVTVTLDQPLQDRKILLSAGR